MTINWDVFYIFTIISVILWIISSVASATRNGISKTAVAASLSGSIVFLAFIIGLWIYLQRPPLRTMGETRLWYSLFMGISGLITYWRWKYREYQDLSPTGDGNTDGYYPSLLWYLQCSASSTYSSRRYTTNL